jgi:hypothetical protein
MIELGVGIGFGLVAPYWLYCGVCAFVRRYRWMQSNRRLGWNATLWNPMGESKR